MNIDLKKNLGTRGIALFCLLSLSLSFGYSGAIASSKQSSKKLASISMPQKTKVTAWQPKESKAKKTFMNLVDRFFEDEMKDNPTWATDIGVHTYDSLMPSYSEEAINKRITVLQEYLNEFKQIKPGTLDSFSQMDLSLLISHIQSELLELQEICSWRNNPDFYPSSINSAIFTLIKRNFAPPIERMKFVTDREKAAIEILKQGKTNVVNPPKIYTEIALEQMPGIIEFFEKSVPEAFTSVDDSTMNANFKAANSELISELKSYQTYLKNDLLPKSNGTFAIGADKYAKKLLYDEMVDESLESLLDRGNAELKRLQKEFADTAHSIDPNKSAEEVFVGISVEHPKPNELINSVKNVLNDLRQFCISKGIVTVPQEQSLTVEETPPFMRALTFASMDMPGPLEARAKEAYYNVTLPEANWTAQRTEEHMRTFCLQDLLNTSVHEAYPGHYLQGLWIKVCPSKTRKIIRCNSNSEGWAHYCEQMMVDQGLSDYDKKLKLVQVHDALLRCCRYIVGIKMHTKGMTIDEGVQFFVKEGCVEKANAERETKRGTMDPTYCVYTLGKMQILSLLDDYKKEQGDRFSLKEFHNVFLAQGAPPIKMVRQALLHSKKSAKK